MLLTSVQITPILPGSSNLLQLGFSYPASPRNNGNIVGQTIQSPSPALSQAITQSYQYDAVNRIYQMNDSGGLGQTYSYDPFGNMATTAGALSTQPGHTPTSLTAFQFAANQTNNQWVGACGTPPCYDEAGNQVAVAGDVYAYDAENRMTTSNAQAMGSTTYGYDGEGRRVWKTSTAQTTIYAYDAAGELAAEYSTGTPPAAATQYLSTDHLGTTRLITDGSGNVVSRYDYVPFGQEIPDGSYGRGTGYGGGVYPSSPDVQSLKFTRQGTGCRKRGWIISERGTTRQPKGVSCRRIATMRC